MMTTELARRFGPPSESNISVHAVHPGVVASSIARDWDNWWLYSWVGKPILKLFGRTPKQGAATGLHVATSKEGAETTGLYWDTLKPKQANPLSWDYELCGKLYHRALKDVGLEESAI